MSGGDREWRTSERIMLGVVAILAVLVAFRLATREPAVAPLSPVQAAQPPATAQPPGPARSGPPPSPACAELLARIRASSERDLEGIVNAVSGPEALGLYRQLSASDRQAALAALPAPLLARKANELLGVPESCFRGNGGPGRVAAFLVDAAMGSSGIPADPQAKVLAFTTVVDEQGVPVAPRGSFRPEERKIYACMDVGAESAGESGVLVRWTEADSGSLVYLHYLPLAAIHRWNYVFFEASAAWSPGVYHVRFYRLAKPAGMIAEGSYLVEKGE